jgi:small subunit ribosomal protein S20
MAHSKSALKRAKQSTARRAANKPRRSALRTQLKKVIAAVESGDNAAARAEFTKASVALDKAASKGLIHKNHAARRKSRLAARIAALDSGA